MSQYDCYFNGNYFPLDAPLFASNDLSLLRGYGLFDYFRTYNGTPFRWNDYWTRFSSSARQMNLPLPVSQSQTAEILEELRQRSGAENVAYRLVLTGGYSPDSVQVIQPNLLIRCEPVLKSNSRERLEGIKVLPFQHSRDLPEIKITNYIHMIRMAEELSKTKSNDLLYHANGLVSELTRSNLFLFKNEKLITPNESILHGITRKVVIELAAPHFEVEVRPVTLSELLNADEVFTTSSTKWITAVRQIGDQVISDGIGVRSRELLKLLETYINNWK